MSRSDVMPKPKRSKSGCWASAPWGSGTFQVLSRNQEEIRGRAGRGIEIAMVADLDTARARSIVGDSVPVVGDARQVIANPEIDIVVELIAATASPARWYWRRLPPASTW